MSERPTKTKQSETHVLRRRLSFHKQGVRKDEEQLAWRLNTIKDIEARLAELEPGDDSND